MFVYQKPGSDKGEAIWRDGPESVIAALILVVAMEAPKRSQKHMYSVYKILLEMGRTKQVAIGNRIIDYVPLTSYLDSLPIDHPARDAYGTAALAPERTRGSFFSSAASLLKLFSDPSIAYLTSYQDHVITDVGDEKTAIFLIIPDEDKTRHPYAALYINQVYDALVEHANRNNGRLKVRTNMLLDEFGNMPPFPDFDTKLTVSLGRGIRWNMVLQAYSQLNEKYGQHVTSTIKSNAQNTIFLKTTDQQTMNELSKRVGTYTIQTEGSSYNVGKVNVNHGGSSSYTGRALLTPDEIERWPNNLSLVLRGGYHPAKLPLPDLSMWPTDRKFVSKGYEEERYIEKVNFFLPIVENLETPAEDQSELQEESYMDVD